MPKSSSPSPTITPMNPMKTFPQTLGLSTPPTHISAVALTSHAVSSGGGGVGSSAADEDAEDLYHSYHIQHQSLLIHDEEEEEHEEPLLNPNNPNANPAINPVQIEESQHQSPFSSILFRDPDEDDEEDEDDEPLAPSSAGAGGEDVADEAEGEQPSDLKSSSGSRVEIPVVGELPQVDPSPHISSQFYTFNRESHSLMIRCILEGRLATPEEIRRATPKEVLKSWRLVWKDRNEDTAYLTAWKRIQDKLHANGDSHGNLSLYFKNNPSQRVSHFEQWQEIVASCHGDPHHLRHLGLKETIDRIKYSWTVGAKFYGIPESFIRVCISSCPVCYSTSLAVGSGCGNAASRSKRRRFEYTESFDLPARDVPRRLQQLATKHKVVLCIRQKYIRYKPFMAEVKDYACHRAGEPSSSSSSGKKQRVLKREPYQSKRCGCGFRIRAIVPIANYNEKDKTFVYQEDGTAVFKLYAVHSGHEPGPLDGSARIIHRVVGRKGGFDFDPDVYGVREDLEPESFIGPMMVKDDILNHHHSVLQKIQELKMEAGLLEGMIAMMPPQMLHSLSCFLTDILKKLKNFIGQQVSEDCLVSDEEVHLWGNEQNQYSREHIRVFSDKDVEIMEEDESDFGSSLGNIASWDTMAAECQDRKMLMSESCKADKWLLKEDSSEFDEKSILNCGEEEDSKLMKPLRHDGSVVADPNIVGFYPDNSKWYDSPGCLDTGTDSVDGGCRHGGLI